MILKEKVEESNMCLICTELKKDVLTSFEARRNFGEMSKVIEQGHRIEVLRLIWQKEDEEQEELSEVGSD